MTLTLTPLADVTPHMLLLGLLATTLRLKAFALMYTTLIDPPWAFAWWERMPLVVRALQLEQGASLTLTLTPLADVAPHVLLLAAILKLQGFAPKCTTLIDPP
jgi:hypothetical protein